MKKLGIAALAALIVAGCATTYGPRYERASGPRDYGYYDTQLDENRYRVQYRASEGGYYAEDYAMRRAAELTLNQGYDWFQVIGRSRAMRDEVFDRYDGARYYGDDRSYRERPRYGDGPDYDDAVAVLDIIMGYNPPPRASSTYDARQVLDYRPRDTYRDRY